MSITRNVISGLAGVGIVSAGAFAFDATTRDSTGTIVGEGDLGVFSLQVGDCLRGLDWNNDEVSQGRGVPCDEAHVYEVFYETFLDGKSLNQIEGDAEGLCATNFASYVGTSYEESIYYFTYLIPTPESYSEGDREVTCLLTNSDESLMYGSVRGAGR